VMDPFHVVALAGDALDQARQRIQRETTGRRGRSGDPLYGARKTLRTGVDLFTPGQGSKLDRVFGSDQHVELEATWSVYQKVVAAYRCGSKPAGKQMLTEVIDSLRRGVPAKLVELKKLGRTLNRRAVDILAYFDRPGTSNGPTEAINGRLEHLRGTALGFRNRTSCSTRALLDGVGFRPLLHAHLRCALNAPSWRPGGTGRHSASPCWWRRGRVRPPAGHQVGGGSTMIRTHADFRAVRTLQEGATIRRAQQSCTDAFAVPDPCARP